MKKKTLSIIALVGYLVVSVFLVIGTFSLFSVMTKTYSLKTFTNDKEIGEVIEIDSKYEAGEAVTLLASPKKVNNADVEFKGWFIDNKIISENNQFVYTMPKNNVEIEGKFTSTAHVVLKKYLLSFETNDDYYLGPIQVSENEFATKPQNPTSIHQNFVGWYFDVDLTEIVEWPLKLTKNLTIYGKWTPKEYKITWNIEGVTQDTNYEYGAIPAHSAVPTKESSAQYDYVFTGWLPEIAPVTANAIYRAQFDKVIRQYPVKWVVNGEEISINYNYGDLPEYFGSIYKAGNVENTYVFTGWEPAVQSVKGPATYEAQFSTVKNKYALRFESNGGSNIEKINADYNSLIEAPGSVARDGYTFAGWFYDSAFTKPVTWPFNLDGDKTVYAKWTAISFDIIYLLDGGVNNPGNVSTYTLDDNEIILLDPTRAGYVFDGWYRDNQFANRTYSVLGSEKQTVALYAKWAINNPEKAIIRDFSDETGYKQIKVANNVETFNFNDYITVGSNVNWTISADISGNNIINSRIVSALNYEDNFYYLNVTSNNVVSQTKLNVRRKPMYNVKYVAEKVPEVNYTIEEDADNTIPNNPKVNGFTFEGWDKNTNIKITNNITFTANWREHKLGLSYLNITGAEITTGGIAGQYLYSSLLGVKAATYKKDGYTFRGWDKNNDGTADYLGGANIPQTLVNDNDDTLALTAIWEEHELQLSYSNIAGATKLDGSAANTYKYSTMQLTAATYKKDGYKFLGWSETEGSSVIDYAPKAAIPKTLINEDSKPLVLYAVWDVPYTLTIEYRNVEGAIEIGGSPAGAFAYGGDTIKAATYKKDGYDFLGWSETEGSSVIAYAAGSTIPYTLINEDSDSLVLYAVWSNPFTLTLTYENIVGAEKTDGSVAAKYDYESGVITAATYEKPGYDFLGWSKNPDSSVIDYATGSTIPYSLVNDNPDTLVLYAVWSDPFSLTLEYENVTGADKTGGTSAGVFAYGGDTIEAATYKKDGYAFLGWSVTEGSNVIAYAPEQTISYSFINEGSKPLVLYAVWSDPYTLTIEYQNVEGATFIDGEGEGTYNYTQLPIHLAEYSKDDFEFLGWDKDGDGVVDYAPDEELPQELLKSGPLPLILTAVWRAI